MSPHLTTTKSPETAPAAKVMKSVPATSPVCREQLSLMLKSTPRGRLRYDTEAPALATPAPARTSDEQYEQISVPGLISNLSLEVLEEVAQELQDARETCLEKVVKNWASRHRDCDGNVALKESQSEAGQSHVESTSPASSPSVSSLPNAEKKPKRRSLLTPRYEAVKTSPVDDELLRIESQRRKEVDEIKARNRCGVKQSLELIRESISKELSVRLQKLQVQEATRRQLIHDENTLAHKEAMIDSQTAIQDSAKMMDERRHRLEVKEAETRAEQNLRRVSNRLRKAVGSVPGDVSREVTPSGDGLEAASARTIVDEAQRMMSLIDEALVEKKDLVSLQQEYVSKGEEIVERLSLCRLRLAEVAQKVAKERERLAAQQEEARRQAAEAEAQARKGAERKQLEEVHRLQELREQDRSGQAQFESQKIAGDSRGLSHYQQLQSFREAWYDELAPLLSSVQEKSFRFLCQKAVNVPANAISSTSATHLKEKFVKLKNLLAGEAVEFSDMQVVSARHPLGIRYCKSLLAKKLVGQGRDVVSSHQEYAFSYAIVIASLWSLHEDFGRLFYAHLIEACPYLLPVQLQRVAGSTDEEYYKLLGYRYNETGEVEDQPKYLSSIGGLGRLYAAITVSPLAQELSEHDHPHGLGNIWTWLATVLNSPPISDVTATLLCHILEVSGNALWTNYGHSFLKLLKLIHSDYLPLIREVTLPGSSGPLTKLETFLTQALQKGGIKKPNKMIEPGFL